MLGRWFAKPLRRLLCRPRFQPLCERLHQFALAAMNFGGGADVQRSGECVVIELLARRAPSGRPLCVLDVGANVGEYTRAIVAALGPRVVLHSFEPSRVTHAALVKNTVGLTNVRTYNFGLGRTYEHVSLYSNAAESGLASVFRRRLDHFKIDMQPVEEIELRTLDGFCTEQRIEHIDLLKLDVEGNELNVLAGAQRMLEASCVDLIQFEFGGCNIDSRTYFQDFYYVLNSRYRLYRILPGGLVPIDKYKETYEVFVTTNYVAVRRESPPRRP